jgi:putative toxin-antitoxin system antitoxin component (TIGR02293 family)
MLTEHVADVAVSRLRKRKPTMSQNNIDLNILRTKAIAEAVALFEGDQKAAEHWLSTPVRGLGRRKPNDLLATREGIQQVRDIIDRLEHGVFS